MDARVVVVGGGLAGLFTASGLLAAGVDEVLVLDAGELPGGVARTIVRDGYSLEPAAGSLLLPHPHLSPLLDHIGSAAVASVGIGTRYVHTRGRLVSLPASPKAVLAPLVSWPSRLRAGFEPLVGTGDDPDETLDHFMRRRLGDGLGSLLAWVAASGVYAGDPARLSARAAFPAIVGLEDAAGSIVKGVLQRLRSRPPGAPRPTSHIPVGGMSAIADAAAARLGNRYRPSTPVSTVSRRREGWLVEAGESITTEHVVVATGPSTAGRIIGGELGRTLTRSVSAPVVVLGLGGPSSRFPLPDGFGVLAGPDAGTATLGVLLESSYAPMRAPSGHSLVKVIAGGATRPEVVGWDEDRLADQIGGEVARMLGNSLEASFVEIVRHPDGIPQYEGGHLGWLQAVDGGLSRLPGLHLTGWGYRGVGVAHLATDAAAITRAITDGVA